MQRIIVDSLFILYYIVCNNGCENFPWNMPGQELFHFFYFWLFLHCYTPSGRFIILDEYSRRDFPVPLNENIRIYIYVYMGRVYIHAKKIFAQRIFQ